MLHNVGLMVGPFWCKDQTNINIYILTTIGKQTQIDKQNKGHQSFGRCFVCYFHAPVLVKPNDLNKTCIFLGGFVFQHLWLCVGESIKICFSKEWEERQRERERASMVRRAQATPTNTEACYRGSNKI